MTVTAPRPLVVRRVHHTPVTTGLVARWFVTCCPALPPRPGTRHLWRAGYQTRFRAQVALAHHLDVEHAMKVPPASIRCHQLTVHGEGCGFEFDDCECELTDFYDWITGEQIEGELVECNSEVFR